MSWCLDVGSLLADASINSLLALTVSARHLERGARFGQNGGIEPLCPATQGEGLGLKSHSRLKISFRIESLIFQCSLSRLNFFNLRALRVPEIPSDDPFTGSPNMVSVALKRERLRFRCVCVLKTLRFQNVAI